MTSFKEWYLSIYMLAALLAFSALNIGCQSQPNTTRIKVSNKLDEKQRGVHLFGRIDSSHFEPLKEANFEWITLVPYGDQEEFDSAEVRHHRGDSTAIIKRNTSLTKSIVLARSQGFKVFVKPHIWIYGPSTGKWRSDIFPANEENWKLWESSYRDFILRFAKIAEEANAEMFCVGTELSRLTIEKPIFWETLIKDVRKIYSGKITYAANWHKEYEDISFWDKLDYIGIQAYFPLSKKKYPTVDEISIGWNKHIKALESASTKFDRQIIFTELGYKSTADAAIKPWEWIDYSEKETKNLSNATQANCYKAFYKMVWEKDWFEGVHLWQWRGDFESGRRKGKSHLDFTPQGKPATQIISNGFERSNTDN